MNNHADMIYEIDVALGKLIGALEERGLADDTLIVFTSDNGGLYDGFWRFDHDAMGGLRGAKGWIWEGGHRVPLVVKWGNGSLDDSSVPPNTTTNQLVGTHDLMATIAALVGETLPDDQARDSFNFLPVLTGAIGDDLPIRDHIVMEANYLIDPLSGKRISKRHWGYREGPWKLVIDRSQNVMGLYNLATDLAEEVDLKDDPDQSERIESMVENFKRVRAASRTAPLFDGDSDGVADMHDNCTQVSNADQRDTDKDGFGNMCDPDFNNNDVIDPFDLSAFKAVFGASDAQDQDLNGNGTVDPFDLSILKSYYGKPPGPSCCASP